MHTHHTAIALLGVGVGIVAGFMVWSMISPTVTSFTGQISNAVTGKAA